MAGRFPRGPLSPFWQEVRFAVVAAALVAYVAVTAYLCVTGWKP